MLWAPFKMVLMTDPMPAEVHDLRDFEFDPNNPDERWGRPHARALPRLRRCEPWGHRRQ